MSWSTALTSICRVRVKSGGLSPLHLADWITSLAYERLYSKVDHIENLMRQYAGDWEQTCYVILARALGFSTNSEPMERLAMSLPLHFLRKHSDSDVAIEALMFGQGGFLEKAFVTDPYMEMLQKEHRFLSHKFSTETAAASGLEDGADASA